jgi:hypothetical protein
VRVAAPGRAALLPQLYVDGEPDKARDRLSNRMSPEAREMRLRRPVAAERIEAGALLAERDLILG